jgi:hypothetical protein
MAEPQPQRAQALTYSGCYTSCIPCRAGRLLLGRRPGALRGTLASPPAAAAPPTPLWLCASLRESQDRRRQLEKENRPIKLGVTCFLLALAFFYFWRGRVILGLSHLLYTVIVRHILV